MSIANPLYSSLEEGPNGSSAGATSASAAAAAAQAAALRDRLKKSTMACEMCRKRKVKCIFSDSNPTTCNFCAKYSFKCEVNTSRKRRGPRPKKEQKMKKSPFFSKSPSLELGDEFSRPESNSIDDGMSDDEDYEIQQSRDREDEGKFINFLQQLTEVQFVPPVGVAGDLDVVRLCIQLFFINVNGQETDFLNGPRFLEDLKADKVQPCLINAMCAIAARFTTHQSLYTQPRYFAGAMFAKAAREQCQLHQPIFRLYIVQTLTILALYSFSINEGAQAWFELGAASRIAQIISLKVDPDMARPQGIPEVSRRELEAFLQIAKAMYVMERLLISGTPSRPVTICDLDFFDERLQKKPESPTLTNAQNSPVEDPMRISDETPHIIKLLSIWEQISLFERDGFGHDDVEDVPPWHHGSKLLEFDTMLREWSLQLPIDLEFSHHNLDLRQVEGKGAQLVFLHCLFHHCNIILNRVFLPLLPWREQFRGAPPWFVLDRQRKCLNSAVGITIILEETFSTRQFVMPPFLGYSVFQSCIVLMHHIFQKLHEPSVDIKQYLTTNFKVLSIYRQFYKPAETWFSTIGEMYNVHCEWQSRIIPLSDREVTRQFRRYFDRFEGRIREPPYAVYDDLAYTQGNPPVKQASPIVPRDTEMKHEGRSREPSDGPYLKDYLEQLQRYEMNIGKDDELMQSVYEAGERAQAAEVTDLYNFGLPTEQPSIATQSYANTVEDTTLSELSPFAQIPDIHGFPGAPIPVGNVLSPFDLGSVQTTSSQISGAGVSVAQGSEGGHNVDFMIDEETAGGFENWDPGLGDFLGGGGLPNFLEGYVDQGFLEFLDTTRLHR